MSDIRKASGATTGSLYHFFAGKADIALAVVQMAVNEWAAASPRGDTFAERVQGSVRGLIMWGVSHPETARFMYALRSLALHDPELKVVAEYFSNGAAAAEADYQSAASRGEVRPLAWPVAHALILGPVYDFLQSAQGGEDADALADLFATTAWNAIRL